MGAAAPFLPLWLRSLGFSYAQIGLITATGAATGAASQWALGFLSDRLQSRRPLVALACLGLSLLYVLYPHARGLGPLVALHAFSGFCTFSANTLSAALVIDSAPEARVAHDFARARRWGSVGFLLTAGMASIVPAAGDPGWFFGFTASLYLVAAVAAFRVREPAPRGGAAPPRLTEGLALLRTPAVVVLLTAAFLFQCCMQATSSSLSLLIQSLGGDRSVVSRAFVVAVLAEIPCMALMGRAADRVGRRPVLLLANLALPLRLLLYNQAASAVWVLPIQAFHGLTFAIAAIVPAAYVSDVAPPRLRASGQGLLSGVYAAGAALGPLAAGQLSDRLGLQGMFGVASVVATVGGLVALAALPESRAGVRPVLSLLPKRLRPLARPLSALLERAPLERWTAGSRQ